MLGKKNFTEVLSSHYLTQNVIEGATRVNALSLIELGYHELN